MAPVGRMPERTRDRMVGLGCVMTVAIVSGRGAPKLHAAMDKRIVILISGRGSNMEAIALRCAEQGWPARVVAVVANKASAGGLAFASAQGIATAVVDHKAHATREAFDDALAQAIDSFQPDLLLLAGFMRILGAAFVRRYEGRLLNIHPSLLPAFPGLHTHRRALEAGCKTLYSEDLQAGRKIDGLEIANPF